MARNLTARPQKWFQWASGLLLIAASCIQPVVTAAAAPPIPAGAARIWFYQGYEPPGRQSYTSALIPTILVNGTYVGQASSGTVLYRDVPPGHYDITIPNPLGSNGSAHFDLATGQQAFVKLVFWKGGHEVAQQQGFSALLVPEQTAQAEFANLTPDSGQR